MATYRFGKHPPQADYRTLRLSRYLTPGLAAPPATYNVLASVYQKLNINDPAKLFPMDGNDKLGDCTIAALAHAITVYRGLLGTHKIMSRASVVKLYFHLSGGQDTGLNELDVLNYWRQHKVSSDEILAFAKIDLKNHDHIKQAVQIFGGVYIGFQCQENCQEDFHAGKPWTPGPLTNDGHAVFVTGYDQNELTVLTWGNTQQATWAWWDECVDEAYAIIPPEATAFAGVDMAQLQADLSDVADVAA